MEKSQDKFELDFNAGKFQVSRHPVGEHVIFRIVFSDKRPPLIITRASHSYADNFWTSVPEGRQKEAEEVGKLISEYFRTFE